MRRIVDFSDLDSSKIILPTGQSGLHNSPHYNDQSDLYHFGRYRNTLFTESAVRSDSTFRVLEIKAIK